MAVLVERRTIGIFGSMNAGKSSLMNLLTQQTASIVDPTPGTTADTKTALCELHGLGPVRILDTAGLDEAGALGSKKRARALSDLKESDLALLVIDPSKGRFDAEREWLDRARELGKPVLVLYNLFDPGHESRTAEAEAAVPALRSVRRTVFDATRAQDRPRLLEFIMDDLGPSSVETPFLPFVRSGAFYILVIPMDAETPRERYLRPQAMCEEYITRNWAFPVSFRLDLRKARGDGAERESERRRFLDVAESLGGKLHAVITDSQAVDVMSAWRPAGAGLTTFSIAMINYMSGGRLRSFVAGLEALKRLKAGDRVLIAEACNHSRVGEDIGDVRIPRILSERLPGVVIEHNYGREFREDRELGRYSLIIHCGGCMISRQKMAARLRDLDSAGVPYTNYGLFLAWAGGEDILRRTLELWEAAPFRVQ